MNAGGWSLAERMTRWFAISTASLVMMVAGISAWYVEEVIDRELDRRVKVKLDQAQSLFASSEHTVESFADLARVLEAERYSDPMAWLVWDDDTNTEWGRFGRIELFERHEPDPGQLDATIALGDGLVWRVEPLLSDKRVGLMVDGSEHVKLLHSFVVAVVLFAILAAVAALGCAHIFGVRVAKLLEQVAASARTVRSTTDGKVRLDVSGAPREIRDVANALREMLANIENEAEKARLIVAGLAHELRSPIQNLLGETEVALLRQRSSEEYRAVLKSHLDELRDLGRVVDNLVLLCASQDASRSRELEGFDLGQEAELRLAKDRDRAQQEGLRLELRRLGDLSCYGDREAILLALRNLVTNALKWSPAGGTVRVELTGNPQGVHVLVDDAGPGVPLNLRERVFEPFFQGPAIHGRRAGYGLGLALTRSAVIAHGGRVEIEDSPLGGARFRVFLPRAGRPEHQDVA